MVFSPLEDHQIKDVALLEYLLMCHLKKSPRVFMETDLSIEERISEQTKAFMDFENRVRLNDKALLLPCKVNSNNYTAYISLENDLSSPTVRIFTEKEVVALKPAQLVSAKGERAEREEIEAYIEHEKNTDSVLDALEPGQRVIIGSADISVRNILSFLNGLGCGGLAEDLENFAGENRIFKVVGLRDVPAEHVDHASNIAIHVKDRESALELELALLHEVLAKAGLPSAVNNAQYMQKDVREAYVAFTEASSKASSAAFDPEPLLQSISMRTDQKIDLKNARFVDLNALRQRDYNNTVNAEDLKPDPDKAIKELNEWKMRNAGALNERSGGNLFWTNLQQKAFELYNKYNIHQLKMHGRFVFCMSIFDNDQFPNVQHMIRLIFKKMHLEMDKGDRMLSPEEHRYLANTLSKVGRGYSVIDNKNVKFAFNQILFDNSAKERRIIELRWLIGEIEKELDMPGRGNLPKLVTMQDLHGGHRRAASLIGFALGLDEGGYSRINNVEDLKRILAEENINVDELNLRFAGLSDKYDRGNDPVGTYELVSWLNQSRKLKPITGNHDFWRAISVLGVHEYFDVVTDRLRDTYGKLIGIAEEKGEKEEAQRLREELEERLVEVDYRLKANKNHHIGYWARDAFEHAGWGNIEIDQVNERRANKAISRVNEVLRLNGIDEIEKIDIASKRCEFDSDLKAKKKINAKIRSENEAHRNDPDYQRKEEVKLPNILKKTLAYLRAELDRRNEIIAQINAGHGLDIKPIEIDIVTLDNYRRAPEVMEKTLWDLQNLRLFYVDMFGNLHMHGILPFDPETKKLTVEYKELKGLPALEMMQEDIRNFFIGYREIPDSHAFRKKMWEEVGEALTIINEWYSDKKAYAKAAAVREFVDLGGPAELGADILGFPVQEYSARPVSFMMILGHNERKKFAKGDTQMPFVNIFTDTGSGILHIDYEMSEGYANRGAVLTFLKRDKDGRRTGLRLWGYKDSESETIEDLTFHDVEGMSEEQLSFLRELADGESFMKWLRIRSLREILALINEPIEQYMAEGKVVEAAELLRVRSVAEEELIAEKDGLGSPGEALADLIRNREALAGKDISAENSASWRSRKDNGQEYSPVTVERELDFLKNLGFLAVTNLTRRNRGEAYIYKLSPMVAALTEEEVAELRERIPQMESCRTQLAPDVISDIRKSVIRITAEKIHLTNLSIEPAISEDKTLWHVIPVSMIPAGQQTAMQSLSQALIKAGSPERILLVEGEGEKLIPKAAELAQDPNNIVMAACTSRDIMLELDAKGIQGLVFEGELGEFRQFEGVLAALRAYHAENISALRNIYRLLTGKLPPAVSDVKEFAKTVIFYLPPVERLKYDQLRDLNENMLALIQAA
ncbi:MAG: hypothetical protein GF409_01485 [Candidatus Omnitrophica bacterium]|nr:hypothetical protein [Candidatus Omnitrophota bacterium]